MSKSQVDLFIRVSSGGIRYTLHLTDDQRNRMDAMLASVAKTYDRELERTL